MVNPLKGEVGYEVEGRTLTLVFDFNAFCALGDRLDLPMSDIMARLNFRGLSRGSFLRAALWAALQAHHPEVDEMEAGRLIGVHGIVPTIDKLLDSFVRASPSTAKPEAGNTKAGPRKAGAPKAAAPKPRTRGTSKASSAAGMS